MPSADVVIVDPPRKLGFQNPRMDVPGKEVLGSKVYRISGVISAQKIISHLEADRIFVWRFQSLSNWCRISAIKSSNYSLHAMLLKQTCSMLFRWMDSKIILNSTTSTIESIDPQANKTKSRSYPRTPNMYL